MMCRTQQTPQSVGTVEPMTLAFPQSMAWSWQLHVSPGQTGSRSQLSGPFCAPSVCGSMYVLPV